MKSVESINQCKSVILTMYDIVKKGHNGTIELESVVGQGSKFIVKLPTT